MSNKIVFVEHKAMVNKDLKLELIINEDTNINDLSQQKIRLEQLGQSIELTVRELVY